MSSDTTTAQLRTIAQRIKSYVNPSGKCAGTLTNNRVYLRRPPDDVAFPHVVIDKKNTRTDRRQSNARETFELEAICYGITRADDDNTELLADVVEQALLTWQESSVSAGLSFVSDVQRDRIPFTAAPANQEICAIRLLANCIAWPAFLTAVA